MKMCETCKHWTRFLDDKGQPNGWGRCLQVTGRSFHAGAYVSAAELQGTDTEADLWTQYAFGCVLHEERVCDMCRGSGTVPDWQGFTKVHDHKPCPKCKGAR